MKEEMGNFFRFLKSTHLDKKIIISILGGVMILLLSSIAVYEFVQQKVTPSADQNYIQQEVTHIPSENVNPPQETVAEEGPTEESIVTDSKPIVQNQKTGATSTKVEEITSKDSSSTTQPTQESTPTPTPTPTTTTPTGWFKTGQEADLVISAIDFNNTGGSGLYNHPSNIATDGTHLVLVDRNNNRVLIWNTPPISNTPPDLVLGQKDFTTNNPGTGRDQMNWPSSVSVGGGKLVVADTYNDRILIWNSFPNANGQAADLMITSGQDNKRRIVWPWGIWTNGTKMAVAATGSGQVLIWNNFPTINDQAADLRLTAGDLFGTPRMITSNGTYLIVGDHNARAPEGQIGNFFWKTWPTSDTQAHDFYMRDPADPNGGWMTGGFTDDNKLLMIGSTLHIWNAPPVDANDKPDLTVGQIGASTGHKFLTGDGSGVVVVGSRVYVCESNGNRITVYNAIPTSASQVPDFAIGSPSINTNTLASNYFITNPVVATDGKSLFITSDFDRTLSVYKNLPTKSGTYPDYRVSLSEAAWDNELYNNTLVAAGGRNIYVWNSLPTGGQSPTTTLRDKIGNVSFGEIRGIAYDQKYLYVADYQAGKVYGWEGIPSSDSNPVFTLDIKNPWRLSSDGTYLAVTKVFEHQIELYEIAKLPSAVAKLGTTTLKFNLPESGVVSRGSLFVGDTGFHRILVWKNVKDAVAGKDPDTILGATSLIEFIPELGKDKLFWPSVVAFDGTNLWAGEYKFSGRILKFSIK